MYIDDIITGRSFEEHLQNLQQLFERLKVAGLKLHPGKCQFLQQKVYHIAQNFDGEHFLTFLTLSS